MGGELALSRPLLVRFDHVEAFLNGVDVEVLQLAVSNVLGDDLDNLVFVWELTIIGLFEEREI